MGYTGDLSIDRGKYFPVLGIELIEGYGGSAFIDGLREQGLDILAIFVGERSGR